VADDLIATGGTAEAAVRLIEGAGAAVVGCCFVIELPELGGRQRLEALGHKVLALCAFEGH
jgi:adenine phosphoribosyltransferase